LVVRTFERAQKVDVVCMKVFDERTQPIAPVPAPQAQCAPVPTGVDGTWLPYHLYALVTQTTRGEIAVVDLTAGKVVDTDRSTPGINFIPVGGWPSDVVTTPDGTMAFVSAAEPNKFAIYAIPSKRLLGDSQGLAGDLTPPPPTITSWPSCGLPQSPLSLSLVPRGDGYELVAVLLPSLGASAKVVTLDATSLLRGAGLDAGPGPSIAPGSLAPCLVTGALELSQSFPSDWQSGPAWDNGLPWVDGGVDLTGSLPARAPSCGADAGASGGGAASDLGPLDAPRPVASVRDGTTLYVADDARPMIHVIDLSTPGTPRELAPLLATSVQDPLRRVAVGTLAISPPTRDYKRFLYAVDQREGSLMVFDISDPSLSPRVPLRRPNAVLNPFQPADRILFNAPVAAVSFVRHDWYLTNIGNTPVLTAKTGLLCNPNPNAGAPPATGPSDDALGAYYRANYAGVSLDLGPLRLRGIFGFVTLSNGQVITLDVDDWDAPCRRPDPLTAGQQFSSLGIAQPAAVLADGGANPADLHPYHVPVAYDPNLAGSPTTLESYVPISAPHRARSSYLLRRDTTSGVRVPYLLGLPQLFLLNTARTTVGDEGRNSPILLPTFTSWMDPTYVANPSEPNPTARVSSIAPTAPQPNAPQFSLPGINVYPAVRFSWEDPLVHVDEDWAVTYEGAIPDFAGLPVDVTTPDAYQTLQLTNTNAFFCRRGVEDTRLGQERVAAERAEYARLNLTAPSNADQWTGDYVQIADDILPVGDAYWLNDRPECWDPSLTSPVARHDACQSSYGYAVDRDNNLQRDFPILEAYEDRLVLGRFGVPDPRYPTATSRQTVTKDPSNVPALRLADCCFHSQVTFNVRTGGRWLAVGSTTKYLHHVVRGAGGACVQSCLADDQLLNARAADVPRPALPTTDPTITWPPGAPQPPGRDSVLALRNPMFSFVIWSGAAPTPIAPGGPVLDHTTTTRGLVWVVKTRGQFTPLYFNLASSSNSVSPQSMRFIESLGQLAVVDGASQGLILIDLNTVAYAHSPYF
jgi:hypothetical protein